MQTQILPIFDMRCALLKRCELKFYRLHEKNIKNSSLAAQDFYFSGDLNDYDSISISNLSHDILYANLHADYNLPFNLLDSDCLNPGLVLDLARALRSDINNGILNANGEIIAPERLSSSQILQTYHNSEDSGIPVTALTRMTQITRDVFLRLYHNIRKR